MLTTLPITPLFFFSPEFLKTNIKKRKLKRENAKSPTIVTTFRRPPFKFCPGPPSPTQSSTNPFLAPHPNIGPPPRSWNLYPKLDCSPSPLQKIKENEIFLLRKPPHFHHDLAPLLVKFPGVLRTDFRTLDLASFSYPLTSHQFLMISPLLLVTTSGSAPTPPPSHPTPNTNAQRKISKRAFSQTPHVPPDLTL